MDKIKTIALVAHDNRKPDLAEWVAYNADKLASHRLICTGTTGKMVEETLARKNKSPLSIVKSCFQDPWEATSSWELWLPKEKSTY